MVWWASQGCQDSYYCSSSSRRRRSWLPHVSYLLWISLILLTSKTTSAGNSNNSDTDDYDPKLAQIEWLRKKEGGYFTEKISFQPLDKVTNTGPNGLFALEDIAEGETVIVIPDEALLKGVSICDTVGKLVDEYHKGDASGFVPYVRYLFESYVHQGGNAQFVTSWSKEGKDLLQTTVLGRQNELKIPLTDLDGNTYVKACSRHWKSIVRDRKKDDDDDDLATLEQLYEDAYRIVISRSWNEVLIPVYDMVNHRNGHYHNLDQSTTTHVKQTKKNKKLMEKGIVPKLEEPVKVVALRDIQKGEQCYISYNECHDTDCKGMAWRYVLPQILLDYGFVEQYPKRWRLFKELVFELEQDPDTNDITLQWLNVKSGPTMKQLNRMRAHWKRLVRMKDFMIQAVAELESKHEGAVIYEFYEALLTALEYAVLYAKPATPEELAAKSQAKNKNVEVSADGTLTSSSSSSSERPLVQYQYDPLKPRPDPLSLDYNVFTCTTKNRPKRASKKRLDATPYPGIHFQFYDTPEGEIHDTCLSLNDWLQTCTGFRAHYHEAFVHYPARFLPNSSEEGVKRVLFLGGGDNMILHEILKYNATLELVIGMELDQRVVRSSYQYLATQPHFDQSVVQWWFGDASKSLQVLPQEYYGTFDIVYVDLQTFVADTLMVTPTLNIMDVAMLLLKPNGGILARNEDFVKRKNTDFAEYTVDLEYHILPYICQQSINLGSNSIDLIRTLPSADYQEVDTLVLNKLDHFEAWYNYRRNIHKANTSCGDETFSSETGTKAKVEVPSDNIGSGVLLVLEAEQAQPSLLTFASIRQAIQKVGLIEVSDTSSMENKDKAADEEPHNYVIVLQEGYLVARMWPSLGYCAFDLLLWSRLDKLESARAELLAAVGSTQGQTSFRIITGGMYGVDMSSTKIGPAAAEVAAATKLCSDTPKVDSITSAASSGIDNSKTLEIVVQELSSLLPEKKKKTVVVICGQQSTPCPTLQALSSKTNAEEGETHWIPILACPVIPKSAEVSSQAMTKCDAEVMQTLQTVVATTASKLSGLVFDASVPHAMGQILYRILSNARVRKELVEPEYTIIMPPTQATGTENELTSWRNQLLDRFRTEVEQFSPAYHTEVFFNSTAGKSLNAGVFSFGDEEYFAHLVASIARIEEQTGLVPEIRRVEDGMVNFIADFQPPYKVTDFDYDKSAAWDQWKSQKPVGVQAIMQFAFQPSKAPVWPREEVLINFKKNVWTGEWFMGKIKRIRDNGMYDVIYNDGTNATETRDAIRKLDKASAEMPLEAGTRVLVRQKDTWYQGAILETRASGTYKVQQYSYDGAVREVKRKALMPQAETPYSVELPPFSAQQLADLFQDAMRYVLPEDIDDFDIEMEDRVGDGCIIVVFWYGGTAVVSWDGRAHIDVNLFVTDETLLSSSTLGDLEEVLLKGIRSVAKVGQDVYPRGYGRVVNFQKEIAMGDPIWKPRHFNQ